KYSHAGATVEIRASVTGQHAVVEIEDGCGGLEPGMVERAFTPFVRFDSSEGGFGLGLAIAKQAADAHGGNIRIQNLPGRGCIFALELPLLAPAAA
ncbi:MAG TPA: sensor histidine kinase, partial [Kofleriaceae bacterium]|nr:sensor histidine kinase [Kofleriaceae bacterium]